MGTLHEIHPGKIRRFNTLRDKACHEAMELYAGAELPELTAVREEITVNPGTLSLINRAWMRGTQDALDALITLRNEEAPQAAQ
jgi:hypothetical protein